MAKEYILESIKHYDSCGGAAVGVGRLLPVSISNMRQRQQDL